MNYYIIVVDVYGTMIRRDVLNEDDAEALFNKYSDMDHVTFCQYGTVRSVQNTYCKGATF